MRIEPNRYSRHGSVHGFTQRIHSTKFNKTGRIALPWDRGIINKHNIREVFLDNGESFVYWRKCPIKVSFLDVLHGWSLFVVRVLLFLGFISRLHCVGLLWRQDANVAGGPKHSQTIACDVPAATVRKESVRGDTDIQQQIASPPPQSHLSSAN